jgi:hypothetical protein
MTSDDCEIGVEIWIQAGDQELMIVRRDFDTTCEARSWLKVGTPAFVELFENHFIDAFYSTLTVGRKDVSE